jgi:hypothetical protein
MTYLERAELGIDGNCGFALLGENLQEGEAEFVVIPDTAIDNSNHHQQYTQENTLAMRRSARLWACKEALRLLRARLNKHDIGYYFGPSHPHND